MNSVKKEYVKPELVEVLLLHEKPVLQVTSPDNGSIPPTPNVWD